MLDFPVFDLVKAPSLWGFGLSFAAVAGFFAFLFTLARFLPAIKGQYGNNKRYRLTGLLSFLLVNLLVWIAWKSDYSLVWMIAHFWDLFIAANLWAIAGSVYLYLRGLKRLGGRRGPAWDFWLGIEQNPEWAKVDLKMYFYQPSLLGMHLFVIAFAQYQWQEYHVLNPWMLTFQAFWWLYLLSHYVMEEFMLSTWDIIAERFGFMLVWGDTVYVPFLYPLCGWFLADDIWREFGLLGWLLVAFHLGAHYLFRVANWQKYAYKKMGKKARIWGKAPRLLENKLLISGFWGIGRHLNYTGEVLVYLSFALCTGFEHVWPYLLPLSLLILLTQRAWRDEKRCREKYGSLWAKYKQKARFIMFPFLY